MFYVFFKLGYFKLVKSDVYSGHQTCQLLRIINRKSNHLRILRANYRKHNIVQLHFNTLLKAKAEYILFNATHFHYICIYCLCTLVCLLRMRKACILESNVCIQDAIDSNESELSLWSRLIGWWHTPWRQVFPKGPSTWISHQAIQGKTSLFVVSFSINFQ